ncbi:MAG: arylamine N-acetyltransferase [Devosia sp.]
MSSEANLDAYLRRINYAGSIAPVADTLNLLHQLHPAAIPFENLDPMMEKPVRLQLSDLEQKLIVEKRGGYCFEQNLLFQAMLESMDFKVTPLSAGVVYRHEPDFVPDRDHMALLVEADGVEYLADVGFGGKVMTAPLRLRAGIEQETPNERYRLTGGEPEWQLDCEIAGVWTSLYRFDLTPRSMDEYVAMNDIAMADFRDDLRVARSEPGLRYGLANARLNTYRGNEIETRMLTNLLEIRDVLTNVFGIQLPQTDRLDPALEKALRPAATA